MQKAKVNTKYLRLLMYMLKTFMNKVWIQIFWVSEMKIPFLSLVNDDFDLSFKIDGLSLAYNNIWKKYKVLNKINSDCVKIDGLLGVDA